MIECEESGIRNLALAGGRMLRFSFESNLMSSKRATWKKNMRDVCDARFVRTVTEENHVFAKSQISKMLSTLSSSDWLRK